MTSAKTTVANPVPERFEAPRPAFQAPSNVSLIAPPQRKDNTPAQSLAERAAAGDELAAKLAEVETRAQKAAAIALAKREGRTIPSAPRKSKKAGPVTHTVIVGPFTPEDVCDDKEFIIRTRSSDIHSPAMKALFWANGGEKYMKLGLGYAAAFSNLRSDKQKALKEKK